uniref:RST domain-containing protein n=1 Tax=Kalanchoe fedtschenkoi TaxID=63787 RepID=A0A7N0UVR3_KALFE
MDPIMKLLEEDEDETMHSGADVDALTAALNRHIEGNSAASQPAESNTAMSQSTNQSQFFHQWQNPNQDGNANQQSQLDHSSISQEECVSGEQKQQLSGFDNQQQNLDASRSQEVSQSPLQLKQEDATAQSTIQPLKPTQLQIPENNAQPMQESGRTPNSEREAQLSKLQYVNQQAISSEQTSNMLNKGKQVPFALLLPVITPQLDKERAMKLNSLYVRLKKNEIPKDGFVRQIRSIVGDQMLKMAVMKLQVQEGVRNSQGTATNQYQLQSQGTTQQPNLSMPSTSAPQYSQTFTQAHQQGHNSSVDSSQKASSAGHVQAISQKAQDEHRPDSHGMQPNHMVSSSVNPSSQERERFARLQGLTKQQQQHLHFSSAPFPVYGTSGGNINHFSGVTNTSSTAVKPQHPEPLIRQAPLNQNPVSTQSTSVMGTAKFDRAHPVTDANRMHGGSSPHLTALQHHSAPWQSATTSANATSTSVKQEPIDQSNEHQQKSQSMTVHVMPSPEIRPGTVPGASKDDALDKDAANIGFQAPTFPQNSVAPALAAHQEPQMSNTRIPSAVQLAGNNVRVAPKKPPVIGQKKPLEMSSPPLSSKKQKVSGGFLDQSIEQLNDVTAISGVNLREEEEHLLSGAKEESRVSEASRRVVQEEEERLILQRVPLQKKLEGIMVKCGVRSISNDVERCLSLCVEERLRGLIRSLIRISKQRIDIEKPKHRTIITSDVRQQILLMNRKSREEWEKKQAEIERLRKLNEPESNPATDGEKEKEEGRGKANKANKEEDDKMRTTAANVAARAAVGGDDMLSKWQLMAEQARQKREGSSDSASTSQPTRDANHKATSLSGRSTNDSQEAEKMGSFSGSAAPSSARKVGRAQAVLPPTRVDRSISVKDVIAVLEREPQVSKSPLIYRLYNKVRTADSPAEQTEPL